MTSKLCSRCKERPAVVFITRIEGDKSNPEGLCLKCARELNIKPVTDLLDRMNLSDEDLEAASEEMAHMMEMMEEAVGGDMDGFMPGGAATFDFMKEMSAGKQSDSEKNEKASDSEQSEKKNKSGKGKKRKFLGLYCTDLTARAKDGQLDRIIGRDRELYRAIQILCRRSKNNPCLIGEPGVGKTAIAEGLALKIAAGDVPAKLMDKEIHLLDMTALVAGTQFRGQFESRIKGLIDEVKAEGNIILFIDEVHSLVGTGDSEGSMNAANILKPALSRGEVQVIGATTFNEYRKHIEKDSALERRFQPVKVEEPSVEDTIAVLCGIQEYYEEFHNVTVSKPIIASAVTLSERYINDRFLPDKAIDLLDEACACASLRNKNADRLVLLERELAVLQEQLEQFEQPQDETPVDYERIAHTKTLVSQKSQEAEQLRQCTKSSRVTQDDLAHVIELWTGIPATKIKESDLNRLASIEDRLKEKIIGQDEAIALVSMAVRRSRVQISPRRRPASFIFAGPTGVGKTELVKVLANQLFHSPETLIRLDMSEFMEKHSVSRIIGSPPGYVGYDEAGQLTEKVRRKPYSVLLFDEIEKAHPDVMNILLQILDDGHITDAQGRNVNFENTIIVMTTNAGSTGSNSLGFGKDQATVSHEKTQKALREFLRPEFIGRVDEVVCFSPLSQEDFVQIALLMLNELKESLSDKGYALTWDPALPTELAKEAYGGSRGARDLRNTVRRRVEDKIAMALIENGDQSIAGFVVHSDSVEIVK